MQFLSVIILIYMVSPIDTAANPKIISPTDGMKADMASTSELPYISVLLGPGALVSVIVIFWDKITNEYFARLNGS